MAVYNSKEYLSSAIESILADLCEDFELLLMDDGSTDGSGVICDSYATEHSNVKVAHLANGGMCRARNVALKIASGEYVTFCDNDDLVLPGFLSENVAVAKRYNADCVRFGRIMRRVGEDGCILREVESCPSGFKVFSGDGVRVSYPTCDYGTNGVWSGLYRKAMLDRHEIRFDESFRSGHEDTLFNDLVLQVANVYVYNPASYYIWIRRATHSASMRFTENWFQSVAKVLEIEYGMMFENRWIESNSSWCVSRLFGLVRDRVTSSSYSAVRSFAQEVEAYCAIRKLLSPYGAVLWAARCDRASDEVMKICLMKERYRELYALSGLGVLLKRRFEGFA